MVKRIGGFRRKSRHKMSKTFRRKGKLSLTRFFQSFEAGEKVQLVSEPAYQKGMYFLRFHGKSGSIKSKRGNCYMVDITDSGKKKELIVHPVHLRKI